MIKDVIIKKINKYQDERGWLAEIFRNDEINYRAAMAYVSATKPGIARGPHEHREQSDCFVFIGPGDFRLYLWDRREESETKGEEMKIEVGENNPIMIIVPPGIAHGYKCISERNGWCLNFPDKLYRGEGKKEKADEIRWEDQKNSPYKMN